MTRKPFKLSTLQPSECRCEECENMCHRPCWPTPEEASALIDNGYGGRLMMDWWSGGAKDDGDILLLCPANPGFEGRRASFIASLEKGCVFHSEAGCELHAAGFKPIEGRLAIHDGTPDELHEAVARTWDNKRGRQVVERWRALVEAGQIAQRVGAVEFVSVDVLGKSCRKNTE